MRIPAILGVKHPDINITSLVKIGRRCTILIPGADRIGPEPAFVRTVALDLRQARYAVPLQSAMIGQMPGDHRLQRTKAVIERQ
jgi:hypothetical protein